MLIGSLEARVSPPIHRFLAYYQAVQQAEAPLGFWERVAASVMLTRAEARECKPPVTCSRTSSL